MMGSLRLVVRCEKNGECEASVRYDIASTVAMRVVLQ